MAVDQATGLEESRTTFIGGFVDTEKRVRFIESAFEMAERSEKIDNQNEQIARSLYEIRQELGRIACFLERIANAGR